MSTVIGVVVAEELDVCVYARESDAERADSSLDSLDLLAAWLLLNVWASCILLDPYV